MVIERRFLLVVGMVAAMGGWFAGCSTEDPVGPQQMQSVGAPPSSMAQPPPAGTAGTGAAGTSSSDPGVIQPPPGASSAGTGGTMVPMAGMGAEPMPPTGDPPEAGEEMAMDECGLHTQWPGDEYCILPPPPDKGFQLHIGPSNYDNPEARYILAAHQEVTNDFTATSGNETEVFFYRRQFRMRPGAHHNIITSGEGGDSGLGQRIGTVNALSEDYPKGGMIAPENEGVGIRLGAKARINVSLHSINVTEQPQLREIWVNFWYRDPSEVTEPVEEMFQPADQPPIRPGQDITFGGSCTVRGEGRMLWMYGHRHANNVRFSAWRVRGTQRDLIYQGYNWEETLVLEYASNVTNPVADTGPNVEGGWSGILDIKTGDKFEWECHVINQTNGTLLFTNNTFTGEMCILDAELVGGNCPAGLGL